jgi:hypothetical protein
MPFSRLLKAPVERLLLPLKVLLALLPVALLSPRKQALVVLFR